MSTPRQSAVYIDGVWYTFGDIRAMRDAYLLREIRAGRATTHSGDVSVTVTEGTTVLVEAWL